MNSRDSFFFFFCLPRSDPLETIENIFIINLSTQFYVLVRDIFIINLILKKATPDISNNLLKKQVSGLLNNCPPPL